LNRNPAQTGERARADAPERRTGVVFLGLIVATNFIPWMQLAEGGLVDTSLASPTESALVIATCLLAAAGLAVAWLLGRRLPPGRGPRVDRPRDAGLILAILAAAANLVLAAVLGGRLSRAAPFSHELRWFGPVWCLLVVPIEIAAAYCKGRASIPFSGAPRLSGRTGPGTVPPLSSL
jgi:small-conductance mechanosensitive channel